uniref:Uncharacterized protein n=1 Tax=Anguilla anguilla TaxID=7936 RepID=A0A0E9WYD1_ANGAN
MTLFAHYPKLWLMSKLEKCPANKENVCLAQIFHNLRSLKKDFPNVFLYRCRPCDVEDSR